MKRFAFQSALAFVLVFSVGALLAVADECRDCKCEQCGCEAHCQKWCHVICEWKDVKETVYGCKCTDVAIPGRSEKQCTKIDECDPNNCPLFHDYKPLYSIWCPSDCARIRPVTKLMKYEVTHKVPTYRWVVEYCCDNCRVNCDKCTVNASQETPSAERLVANPANVNLVGSMTEAPTSSTAGFSWKTPEMAMANTPETSGLPTPWSKR